MSYYENTLTIHYQGTQAQWDAIDKDANWDSHDSGWQPSVTFAA